MNTLVLVGETGRIDAQNGFCSTGIELPPLSGESKIEVVVGAKEAHIATGMAAATLRVNHEISKGVVTVNAVMIGDGGGVERGFFSVNFLYIVTVQQKEKPAA